MKPNIPPKFTVKPLPEEKRKKLLVSFEECAGLTERELNCPYCDYPIDGVFSDATGHLRVKCQKRRTWWSALPTSAESADTPCISDTVWRGSAERLQLNKEHTL